MGNAWAEKFKTCINCGICGGSCPTAPYMDITPRLAVTLARSGLSERILKSKMPWMCVSCYTCAVRCPSNLSMTEDLFPAIRQDVMNTGIDMPQELRDALQSLYRYGNPMGRPPRRRAEWVKEEPVTVLSVEKKQIDVLWIVECYPSYHPRNIEITKKFARILKALNINFGILGHEEKCMGDPARLSGEEGLFEKLVEDNLKTMSKYQFNMILVTDPHAYTSLKHVYPKYNGNLNVQHYSQFLCQRLDELKKLFKKEIKIKVTYHDPCNLGRKNDIYEEPRKLLSAIPGVELVEMRQSKETSLCCGGGGGGMWLDGYIAEFMPERISDRRVKQAVETGADTLAVCCPFEISRFEDSVKLTGNEGKIVVKDVIELIAEAIEGR